MKTLPRNELWPGVYVVDYRRKTDDSATPVNRPLLSIREIDEAVPAEAVDIRIDETFDLAEWVTQHIHSKTEHDYLALQTKQAEFEHERGRFRQEVEDWYRLTTERLASGAREREEGNARRIEQMNRLREELAASKQAFGQTDVTHDPHCPRIPLKEELPRADKLYSDAVSYARNFIDDVRQGRNIDYRDSLPAIDGFIDSVFRNESATAAICKLRMYDEYTYTHSINVAVLAVILGKRLGMGRDQLRILGAAGVFHDVGKAVVPDEILNKPGKLSDSEMDIMRAHPMEGYTILKKQKGIPETILRAALEHHERYDGHGYPRQLTGNRIHPMSRIISVVDVYDALTSKRVYKDPLPPSKVLGMMYQWRLSDFQPNIVEHFIKSLGVYPVGSFIRLDDGRYGVVTALNAAAPLKPTVKVILNETLFPVPHETIDLSNHAHDSPELFIADIINPDEHGIDVAALL